MVASQFPVDKLSVTLSPTACTLADIQWIGWGISQSRNGCYDVVRSSDTASTKHSLRLFLLQDHKSPVNTPVSAVFGIILEKLRSDHEAKALVEVHPVLHSMYEDGKAQFFVF
ncbi:hypothetical protein CPAR01_11427 [Colletotrichum paranaense]|uniref:Uncharacterized protein n=1 Tax=Colletotrichum paranaense TaxID=1914294 RepID=A0ABQ9SCB7_9PEZI|nr:uncharacterized protein CPAR01_11427 [Colletotrichum paranaense]KAK1531778.1 hypothetical protein CPAR01_11427 [Colletotrichum paranaense]